MFYLSKRGISKKNPSPKKPSTKKMAFSTFGQKVGEDGVIRVVIKLNGTPRDQSEVSVLLDNLEQVYQSNQQFVCLYDARAIGRVSPPVLWTIASYLRRKDDQTRERLQKCAIVISSDFAQKLLDSLFVLKPPACPLDTFRSLEAAKAWLRQKE
jgi:hypothetical protein